jgi:hypothetical protein
MPVGVYAAARTGVALLAKRPGRRTTTRFLQVGMVSALITAASLAVAGPGYANYLTTHQNLLSFRSRAYADAGAWIRTNTPQDSLFLVPRAYSGELSFDRNVTWVNFYGNAWVIDAIDEADPAIANEILTEHGVDYVLIQDPTGTYVDVMPGDGMRAFLQFGATDTSYFTLVYATRDDHGLQRQDHTAVSGLRIYRVEHPAPAGLGR